MTPLPNVDGVSHSSRVMDKKHPSKRISSGDPMLTTNATNSGIELEDLNLYSESDRLKTFENWPVLFISKEELAAAGFYYIGRNDVVRCPYCEIEVGYWVENDKPDAEHAKHSPGCRYVTLRKSVRCNRESEFPCIDGEDTCGPNGIEGRRSPVLELERMSKETMMKKLDINITNEPLYKQFVKYSDRINTFSSWPSETKISPESLSEAGFIYSGKDDVTICHHCGGTLHSWDEYDQPWIEHALWYPNCKYVLSIKGQKFIDDARLKKREGLERTQEELRTAIETVKELVSGTDAKNINSECKINESSSPSEGNSNCEVSISPSSSQSVSRTERDSRMTCLICLEYERDSILLPCYHMVACLNCANKLTKCCVCREPVLYRRRVYIP